MALQKYLIRYVLLLKRRIFSHDTLFLFVFLFAALALFGEREPAENRTIAFCLNGSKMGEKIYKDLAETSSVYRFVRVNTPEKVENLVKKGRCESGFILKKKFDENLEALQAEQVPENLVTYIYSAYTVKDYVPMEMFYTAFFRYYSRKIVLKIADEEKKRSISERLEVISKDKGSLFYMEKEIFGEKEIKKARSKSFRGEGFMAILIFCSAFFGAGERAERMKQGVFGALSYCEKKRCVLIDALASITLPALIGVFSVIISGSSLLSYLFMLLMTLFWVMFFECIIKKAEYYVAIGGILTGIQILACNTLVNTTEIFPVLLNIRKIFPAGIYLELLRR